MWYYYNSEIEQKKPCGTHRRAFVMHKGVRAMPTKPKRPCAYPHCGKLCDSGCYCEEHTKIVNKEYNRFQRNPASNRRYGRLWRKTRDRYIKLNPLCEQCKKNGKLTQAQEVHHILPLSQGGSNKEENLMALCKPCHSRITAEMGDRWHKRDG